MADYSQPPPFNFPFPIPPQFFQQPPPGMPNPPPNMPPGSADAAQNPFAGFQFGGGIPGLNMQSYNQNAQQQPYMQWPQAPPPQQLQQPQPEQQNAFGSMQFPAFVDQNGFPVPPPPPPFLSQQPVQQPVQHALIPPPSSAQPPPPPQASQQLLKGADNRFSVSSEEDGEVSEGDAIPRQAVRFGDPIPTPRSAPQSSQNGHGSSIGGLRSDVHAPHQPRPKTLNNMPGSREEAKHFVKLLHENNISMAAFAREGLDSQDSQFLAAMYGQFAKPVIPTADQATAQKSQPAPAIHEAQKAPGSGTQDGISTPQAKTLPAVKTNNNPTPPKAAAAPSPVDRSAYIARLQAAKKGKQALSDKATPPQSVPAKSPAPPAVEKVQAQLPPPAQLTTSDTKTASTREEKEKRRIDQIATDRIRQKLEALQARHQSSAPATPQAITAASESAYKKPSASSPSQPNGKTQPATLPRSEVSGSVPMQASPFSRLPGLFMNTATTTVSPKATSQLTAATSSNPPLASSNKRPAGTDFDEVATPRSTGPAYTRPIGDSPYESHNEQMIIHVSEDESAGSDMDVDDDQAVPRTSLQSLPQSRGPNGSLQRMVSFPPASALPSRPSSIRPSPAIGTPPTPSTPAAHQQRLSTLEKQKLELRLELEAKVRAKEEKQKMELEAKLKAKEAIRKKKAADAERVLFASSAATPVTPNSAQSRGVDTGTVPTASSSEPIRNALPVDGQLSTGATSEDRVKERQAQLEKELRDLETSFLDTSTRLTQVEIEKVELQAKQEKIQQAKDALSLELASLAVNNDAAPLGEARAEGDRSQQRSSAGDLPVSMDATSSTKGTEEIKVSSESLIPTDADVGLDEIARSTQSPTHPMPTTNNDADPASPPGKQLSSLGEGGGISKQNRQSTSASTHVETGEPAPRPTSVTPADEEVDFYSPEPVTVPTLDLVAQAAGPAQDKQKSPSEEGEIEMSESTSPGEEEDYDPENYAVDNGQSARASTIEPLENDAMDIASTPMSHSSSSSTSEDEGEIYEPPETDLEMQDAPNFADGVVALMQPPEVEDQGAMDTESSSSDDSDSSEESDSEIAKDAVTMSNMPASSVTVADDLAPELQPQSAPAEQVSAAEPDAVPEHEVDPTRFVPYESPLRMFKSYRYHPNFATDVEGGFLSLTYSHQIDPEKPLCPFESVGGSCNDPTCPGQHFKAMGISGEKLLVQLGTANPGKTPEEKQRWNDGLRGVLKKLREQNIKDHDGIATEIAKFRRDEYFRDETRVVNL